MAWWEALGMRTAWPVLMSMASHDWFKSRRKVSSTTAPHIKNRSILCRSVAPIDLSLHSQNSNSHGLDRAAFRVAERDATSDHVADMHNASFPLAIRV